MVNNRWMTNDVKLTVDHYAVVISFRIGRGARAHHRQASDEWYLHVVRDTPTPTVDAATHDQQPNVPDDEFTVTTQVAISHIALPTPASDAVEKAADEVRLYHRQLLAVLRVNELSMMF